jgi:hypothetical protein
VAFKGKRLAFVEVKQRRTFEDADWSLSAGAPRRSSGPRNIGSRATQTMPAHDITFDVVLATP